jgi:hypothetical protein
MAEPARPFWEADELVAKAPPRQPAKGSRPFWEEDELVATKAETKANPGDEIYAAGAGAYAKAQGQDFGPEYERQLAETQAANKAAKEANPWSYGIAEAVGAVPGLVYGGTTALGAKALGMGAGNFAARSAAAAASGMGIGAVQGAASADPGERLVGAGFGAGGGLLVGAASPAIGAAVGKGAGWVSDAVRSRMAPNPAGMSNAAADALTQDLKAAGGGNAVRSRLDELGPDARLLDASPSFQGRAQGLAIQPETREMIVDPLVARNQGTNQRLAVDFDTSMGPAPVPSQVKAEIHAGRELISTEYTDLFRNNAMAVDTRALADKLDTLAVDKRGEAATAIAKVRGYLDIPGNRGNLDPNPAALFETRNAIDGLLETEVNTKVSGVLKEARKDVDSLLRDAVPGIKQIDAKWQELARQTEALDRGAHVLDVGRAATRPTEFADEFAAAALPQGEMVGPSGAAFRMRQGNRADVDRVMGTHINDLNEAKKLVQSNGDWNYTKLVEMYGSRPAAKVWNALDRETAFRKAHQDIVEGSKTAMRIGAAEGTKVRGDGGMASAGMPALAGIIGGPQAALLATGAQGVKAGANQVMKAADLTRNRQIAESLIMQPGPQLDGVIDGLAQRLMAQSQTQMTAGQARELAQIMVMSQGDNAGEGVRRVGGLAGLGGFTSR